MSYQNLLSALSPGKPILNTNNAILSAPVRHIFIIGTVWYLAQQNSKKPLNVLEIGSWFGASALSWGQGLKLYCNPSSILTCLDSWVPFFDIKLHDNNWYQEMEKALSLDIAYNIFLHNMKCLPQTITCQHIRAKSENALPLLKEGGFDVIFIDADHTYSPVKKDILFSMPLVADGGIICGDDLNLQMNQCDQELARKSGELDLVKDTKTGRNFHPGVTLAVDEIFGEVSMWGGYWAMQKKGDKWQKISLKDMPVVYPEHFPPEAIKRAEDHFKDLAVLV